MDYFTPDQYHTARHASLIAYIQSRGYPLKRHGHELLLVHPKTQTTTIRGNSWYRHSRGIGGGPLEFLTHIEGIPEYDAVRILASGAVERAYDGTKMSYLPYEAVREQFELPAAVKHPARVFAYLNKTRCIDPQIIQKCLHEKILFESEKYHNCVFVGYDGDIPKYASLRGTSTYADKPFRMDAKGSDKHCPFVMRGKSDLVFTFESPIDAMSHATFFKIQEVDWERDTRLSLGGVAPLGLMKYLEQNARIKRVVLCLDNDEAGREATKRIKSELREKGYEVFTQKPLHKDWNASLTAYFDDERRSRDSREDEELEL